MAKRRGAQKSEPGQASHVHIVKLRLNSEEVQLIRVAAAVNNLQSGVFAKEIVLAAAREIVGNFRKD